MNGSLIAAGLWMVIANILALIPSKDDHWFRAYVLIAVGVPILGWVFIQHGGTICAVVLGAGLSILRWPVYYLYRFGVRALTGDEKG